MYALVDGNNFYVSCERVFRPSLGRLPVIVLSNNDGCAIARSNEAKAMGIKMGQPWHEVKHLEEEGVVALSANFALYGDMSDRMMSIAAGLGPEQEIYSIDECFIGLAGVRGDLKTRASAVRERILQWVGIPCCIGLAPTKTLAKLANHIAKQSERKPGSYPVQHARVCDLSALDRNDLEGLLAATAVGDVWGVGRQIGKQLMESGIRTALDLSQLDSATVKRRWSVVLERTVLELRGAACIALEQAPAPRQQIACTRSFGKPVGSYDVLAEAVSSFAAMAAAKLRRQASSCGQVLVFVRTSPFRNTPQYSRSAVVPLRRPTGDTAAIVSSALHGLRAIYRPGYQLAKAGVMLLEVQPTSYEQFELDLAEPHGARDRARLMQAMDMVNERWGRGTLQVGSERAGGGRREWAMKQERRSPAYTTEWAQMPIART